MGSRGGEGGITGFVGIGRSLTGERRGAEGDWIMGSERFVGWRRGSLGRWVWGWGLFWEEGSGGGVTGFLGEGSGMGDEVWGMGVEIGSVRECVCNISIYIYI